MNTAGSVAGGFDWPYFTIVKDGIHTGKLADEEGDIIDNTTFADVAAAEAWLEENDIHGSVQS